MERILAHRPARQPAREAKSRGGKPGMSWANSFSQVQMVGLVVTAKGAAVRLEHAEMLGDEQFCGFV
jgi:hypothetical protein